MLPYSQIDKNTIQEYRDNFDYAGLANYLSNYYVEDKEKQRKYLGYINQYRNIGNKLNGMMKRATDDEKQAIQFQMGLQRNHLPQTFINSFGEEQDNKYTKQFVDELNATGGEDATTLEFMLEGYTLPTRGWFGINWNKANDIRYKDSGFDLFSKGTGYTEQDLANMGVKVTHKDGNTILSVTKDNPYIANIFMGMQYVNTNRDTRDINNPVDPNQRGVDRYKIRGLDADGNPVQVGSSVEFNAEGFNRAILDSPFSGIMGTSAGAALSAAASIGNSIADFVGRIPRLFTSDERDYEQDEFRNPENIHTSNSSRIYNLLNRVRFIYDSFTNPNDTERMTTFSGQGVAIESARRAELEQRRMSGLISNEEYNAELKTYQNEMRLALSQPMGDKEFYSNIYNDDSDDVSLNKLNTQDRVNAEKQLHVDVNRDDVTWYYMQYGDMIGTYIVVPAQTDKNKEVKDGSDGKERIYFIKDLFKDKAEEALRRDTKTRSQLELSNMQTYEYDYDIPEVGKLKNVTDQSAIIEDLDGEERIIDRTTALNYLNKAMIYQDAIDMANQNYWYDNGDNRDYIGLKNDVNTWAQLSMSELYPTAWQRYIEALQRVGATIPNLDDNSELDEQGESDRLYLRTLKNQMVSYILSKVGYNFNGE